MTVKGRVLMRRINVEDEVCNAPKQGCTAQIFYPSSELGEKRG